MTSPAARRSRRTAPKAPPRPAREAPPRIALIGMMGSGKTTVGRRLARLLGYAFVDMDMELTLREEKSIPALFRDRGESGFRRLETTLLQKLSRSRGVVVSTGGGIVLRAGNRRLLRNAFATIWLRVPAVEIMRRVGKGTSRPLLRGTKSENRLSYIRKLARSRALLYSAAGTELRAAGKSPDQLARAVARKLGIPR